MTDSPTLILKQECKIADLLPNVPSDIESEPSGVLARDGNYFVVFDNHTSVARLSDDLRPNESNGLFGKADVKDGYEGITYNEHKGRFYLLVESRKQDSGRYHAEVFEYDDTLSFVKSRRVDFEFDGDSKGFEAMGHVRRDDQDYVLALCEGNKCKSGSKGRKPGGGRIQLFEKKKTHWSHAGKIKLPKSLPFEDYSGMAIDNQRVAVVSQQNSMLWIGVFDSAAWSWRDEGQIYQFPRSSEDKIIYGTVEGVAWITPNQIVTVSDQRKNRHSDRFADKDQSIHIFELPR